MSTLEDSYLDAFPSWLSTLADDALALTAVLEAVSAQVPSSEASQRHAAAALDYLLKSLDLIQDGLEDLGFMEDAFVLRVVAAFAALEEALADGEPSALSTVFTRLSEEAPLVREFLGDDYARLSRFVQGLSQGSRRGRSVSDLLGDEQLRAAFMAEVRDWAASYAAPRFSRDARNLVKLRAFLRAKLPA
jgi:uncharacterized membrane protein YkvA (DUF1232 family)